ncbi:4914_t:CDS:2 [Cetraspora pellucida]|uniref:4914_t:CDS:1 n=1 Tax=Cetraspora pellucida TaxID=1433469 RepID=A0A9N8Z538_9GLOM|nr:4914_t:CDS:2 [Cetraspora pellucida]
MIRKPEGNDKFYLRFKKYFERDGVVKLYFKGKWVCLISDPTIAKDLCLRTGSITERHFGVNVVHSNGDNLEDPHNVYVTAYNEAHKVFRNPFFSLISIERIPILRQLAFRKIDRLNNLLEDIIKEKRKSLAAGQSNGDLLELMLKACEDSDNPTLSDIELRHNLAIFMVAGHDTTATALSTLLYLLAVHKDVQRKAREEVLKILDDNLTPSAEQHASLKYLNMVIRENLRLYPPVPTLPLRVLTEDLKYKNFLLPAGTFIGLFLYGIQNSSKLWENPEKFLPERFENEHENYSWLAFGGGSRIVHKDGLKIRRGMSPYHIELIFKRRNE